MYKQKVKHLLYEHQAHVSKLKVEGEAVLKQQVGAAVGAGQRRGIWMGAGWCHKVGGQR